MIWWIVGGVAAAVLGAGPREMWRHYQWKRRVRHQLKPSSQAAFIKDMQRLFPDLDVAKLSESMARDTARWGRVAR